MSGSFRPGGMASADRQGPINGGPCVAHRDESGGPSALRCRNESAGLRMAQGARSMEGTPQEGRQEAHRALRGPIGRPADHRARSALPIGRGPSRGPVSGLGPLERLRPRRADRGPASQSGRFGRYGAFVPIWGFWGFCDCLSLLSRFEAFAPICPGLAGHGRQSTTWAGRGPGELDTGSAEHLQNGKSKSV